MTKIITITERDIKQLRDEARAHDDIDQVYICSRALQGCPRAWRECQRVIAAARAMADSDE